MLRPKIAPACPGPESRRTDAKSSADDGKLWRTAEPRTASGGAEALQPLRSPAAFTLQLGKRDAEDRDNWRALISAAAFEDRSKSYLPFLRPLIFMMAGDRAKERRQPTNPPSSKPRPLDDFTCEEETRGIMKLAEVSLAEFLEDEPDIYTLKDLKVKYK